MVESNVAYGKIEIEEEQQKMSSSNKGEGLPALPALPTDSATIPSQRPLGNDGEEQSNEDDSAYD